MNNFKCGFTFFSDNKPIFSLGNYTLKPAYISSIWSGLKKGTTSFIADSPDLFTPGNSIEIRNEFRFGRANYPITHSATVTSIQGHCVYFEPALESDRFWGLRGSIAEVLKQPITLSQFRNEADSKREFRLVAHAPLVSVEISIKTSAQDETINASIERRFHDDIKVKEENLEIYLHLPLRCVFRKNRLTDIKEFQSKYWLEDQGFVFGSQDVGSYLVFGQQSISALELTQQNTWSVLGSSQFRASPYDTKAMLDRDIATYGSARSDGRPIQFEFDFDKKPVDVMGIRLSWHKDTAPGRIELKAKNADGETVGFATDDIRNPNVPCYLAFKGVVACMKLEVKCYLPEGENLLIRYIDVLWHGTNYKARFMLYDSKCHRHYKVLGPAPVADGYGGAKMVAQHYRKISKGEIERADISICQHGENAVDYPRPMHVPNGFRAAFIWTEHADTTSLNSHRAVCFGSSEIKDASEAIGGFVGYKIPVTKSVYYANPRNLTLPNNLGLQACLRDTPEMLELCQQLQGIGWEIAIHSPQPDNSTRQMNEEAIDFLTSHLGCQTWIDHSCAVVHNGISALGLQEDSPHFIGDLLEKSGILFAWGFASEDSADHYFGGLSIQQTKIGDWATTPLYWNNQNTTNLVLWPTTAGTDISIYSDEELDFLIKDNGVAISHVYPAYHYPTMDGSPYFETNPDKKEVLRTTSNFESVLQRISSRNSRGRLGTLTVSEWITYNIGIRSVIIRKHKRGWYVQNLNNHTIYGFSLITNSEFLEVHEVNYEKVCLGLKGSLLVFDLKGNETVNVRYKIVGKKT